MRPDWSVEDVRAWGRVRVDAVNHALRELPADRIVRYAEVVGRERIVAGADCGFASFAATVEFMPEIVWAKLEALAEGARRASERLWS